MNYQEKDYLYVANILDKLDFHNQSFMITGSTGLIGSFIINALHYANLKYRLNNRIIAVVRNKDKVVGLFPWIKSNEIELIVQNDITEPLPSIYANYIIHAAGNTDSSYMVSNPAETAWGIIDGTRNILEFSRRHVPDAVAVLSSMEVYGQITERILVNENSPFGFIDPFNVRSCYPMAKRIIENFVCSYAAEYDIPVMALRLAQTFGYPVAIDEKRLFGMMIRAAKRKEDIILATRGEKINNFCYLADAAAGIFYVLRFGMSGNCYNVCDTGSSMPIIDNAWMIARDIMNGQISVRIEESVDNSSKFAPDSKYILDSSKLHDLGWETTVDVFEAYRRNICE